MKKVIISAIILFSTSILSAQFIATVEMKENVEGICDHNRVFGLFNSFEGQKKAECSLNKLEIQKLLNEAEYLKSHPKFKAKGMFGVYINCKGEPLEWKVSVKTNKELDAQLLAIFMTLEDWTTGQLNGENVDSRNLISYKIKKGVLTIN